jgi:uncharacterized membrane protein YgdD (TMEM256/DUF423 family)
MIPSPERASPRGPRLAALAGALLGLLGVAAGAFGAHALRGRLPPESLATFETATRFQMIHALALLASAWVQREWPGRAARAATALLLAGTLLFCGSLYLIVAGSVAGIGLLTPAGGLLLLAGWGALAIAAWRGARRDGNA